MINITFSVWSLPCYINFFKRTFTNKNKSAICHSSWVTPYVYVTLLGASNFLNQLAHGPSG